MLGEIQAIVFPVFALIGVGYLFARFRQIDLDSITHLTVYVLSPCLVFSSLVRRQIIWAEVGAVAGGAAAVVAGCGLLAFILFGRSARRRSVYLPVMFMNSGNMGLPICLFAFGDFGLSRAVIYFVTVGIIHVSAGVAIASGDRSLHEVTRFPLIYAAILALVLNIFDISLPGFLSNPIRLLGDATIPLMLFSLGCQLRSVRISGLWAALAASVLRIGGGLAIALAYTALFGITGVERSVILLVSSMPAAVLNFMLARNYRLDTDFVSSVILISTIMSIFTIPAVLYLISVVT